MWYEDVFGLGTLICFYQELHHTLCQINTGQPNVEKPSTTPETAASPQSSKYSKL